MLKRVFSEQSELGWREKEKPRIFQDCLFNIWDLWKCDLFKSCQDLRIVGERLYDKCYASNYSGFLTLLLDELDVYFCALHERMYTVLKELLYNLL